MDDEIMIEIPKKQSSPQKTNKKQNKTKKNSSNIKKANKKAAVKQASKNRTSQVEYKEINKKIANGNMKNKKYKKKKINKIFILIILIIITFILLCSSTIFNITVINVSGNNRLTEEEIISLSNIQKHTNLFKMNKLQSIDKLTQNAYIEDVMIKRKFPNTVDIEIKERIPKYMLQFADSYVYINNQGYMLEISNEKLEIPILIGITTDLSNIKAGNRMNTEDLKKMDMVINIFETASSNEIGNLITKIDISDDRNYTLILEKVDDCESGDDAVVMVNGDDGTFKRVFKNENGIILQPLNPTYSPMVYTNEQIEKLPVKVLGIVVEIRRKKRKASGVKGRIGCGARKSFI